MAMSPSVKGDAIHIRGTPPSLFSILQLEDASPGPLTLELQLPLIKRNASLPTAKLSRIKGTDLARCKLRLDRMTPPGIYKGTVEIQKQHIPLVVEVESRRQLRLFPKYANLEASRGSQQKFRLTMINAGNVPFEIPKLSAFGLYDQMGVDTAVGKVFNKKSAEHGSLVEHLMQQLQQGYGGIVKLDLGQGAGELNPGEVRELEIDIHIPDDVVPGRPYWGLWKICDYNFKFEIDITAAADPNVKHREH
jgi:hypothetical protein